MHVSTQPDVRKREAGAQQVRSRLEPPAALAHGVQVLLEAVEGLSELARPLLLAWLGVGGLGLGAGAQVTVSELRAAPGSTALYFPLRRGSGPLPTGGASPLQGIKRGA